MVIDVAVGAAAAVNSNTAVNSYIFAAKYIVVCNKLPPTILVVFNNNRNSTRIGSAAGALPVSH